VDSAQRGVYEQVEHDLRMALKDLQEAHMEDVARVREVRALIREAHAMVEFVLLGKATNPVGAGVQKTA
jgi:hypothetical protein